MAREMGRDRDTDTDTDATAQRTDGRERLLREALALFLEAGYDGVSMQRIAAAAGVTKGAPYHHFAGKDDLFAHAVHRHLSGLELGIVAALDAPGDLRQGLIDAFCHFASHADAGMARLMEDLQRHVGAERIRQLGITPECLWVRYRERFAAAAAAGVPLAVPPERAADALLAVQIGTMHRLLAERRQGRPPSDVRELATGIVDALLYGVLARD